MDYQKISDKILRRIEAVAGKQQVLTEPEDLEAYSHDETPGISFLPEVVVKVKEKQQIAELLDLCNRERIPLTPRGGGTGLTGGAIPLKGGLVISFERMAEIKDIDPQNSMVVVEPGVITGNLQRELARYDLFYPVNPASLDSCTIGGNVAESSSGANAVKYGGTRDYVCGLEAILPGGGKIKAGGKLVKNVTDHRFIQVLLGSEGILAVFTEITLRVIPLPAVKIDLIIPLKKILHIQNIVTKIWEKKILPTSIEYIDKTTHQITKGYVEHPPSFPQATCYLLVGLDGKEENEVMQDAEKIGNLCMEEGVEDILIAQERSEQEKLWKFRQSIRDALLSISPLMIEEDIVVPRSRITEFLEYVHNLCKEREINAGIFGHLGDGNVHINFLNQDFEEKVRWEAKIEKVLQKLFKRAIFMGGKISGEHGIGLVKKAYLPLVLSQQEIDIMKELKLTFDPKNILNPGKIFDL